MSDTKTVTFKVVRKETWYAKYDVPAHLDEDETLYYIYDERPDEVFDEAWKPGRSSTISTATLVEDTPPTQTSEEEKQRLVDAVIEGIKFDIANEDLSGRYLGPAIDEVLKSLPVERLKGYLPFDDLDHPVTTGNPLTH